VPAVARTPEEIFLEGGASPPYQPKRLLQYKMQINTMKCYTNYYPKERGAFSPGGWYPSTAIGELIPETFLMY